MEGARIYDLDASPVEIRNWWELENTKIYYDFCQEHRYPSEKLGREIRAAVDDAFSRLLEPSLTNEVIREAKEKADQLIQDSNAMIENTIRTIREAQADKELTRLARQELTDFKETIDDRQANSEDELRIQRKIGEQWVLYAEYLNHGYVATRMIPIHHSDSPDTYKPMTVWTQAGRKFLYDRLKKHGVIPMIERTQQEGGAPC